MEPIVVEDENETAIEQMCIDFLDEGWRTFKIVLLSTVGKIGFEPIIVIVSEGLIFAFDHFRSGLSYFLT